MMGETELSVNRSGYTIQGNVVSSNPSMLGVGARTLVSWPVGWRVGSKNWQANGRRSGQWGHWHWRLATRDLSVGRASGRRCRGSAVVGQPALSLSGGLPVWWAWKRRGKYFARCSRCRCGCRSCSPAGRRDTLIPAHQCDTTMALSSLAVAARSTKGLSSPSTPPPLGAGCMYVCTWPVCARREQMTCTLLAGLAGPLFFSAATASRATTTCMRVPVPSWCVTRCVTFFLARQRRKPLCNRSASRLFSAHCIFAFEAAHPLPWSMIQRRPPP